MRRRPLSSRAGLTLLESILVCAFVGVFVVFLAGTIITSTTLNRDTYLENEVVDLANRTADEMAASLSGAGRFTDAWDLSPNGDILEFQDSRFDASGNKVFGARTVRGGFSDWGVRRLVYVQERTFDEVALNLDIDGDGLRDNPAVSVGRFELRVHLDGAAFSTTEQVGLRQTFGGQRTRFCRRPGVPASPPGIPTAFTIPIFSRTPATGLVSGTFYEYWPRIRQVVRTEDDVNEVAFGGLNHNPCDINGPLIAGTGGEEFPENGRTPTTFYPRPFNGDAIGSKVAPNGTTAPSTLSPSNAANEYTDPFGVNTPPIGAAITEPDTAVRINLRVVYNPTPDSGGRPELHAFNLARTVSLQ